MLKCKQHTAFFFLDCFDCLRDYGGECPVHGPLNIVKDTMVSSAELFYFVFRLYSHSAVPSGKA